MRTIMFGNTKIEVKTETFKDRWQNDGTKCGLQFRDTRVAVGKRANLKSEKVGDEVGFPLYITFNVGQREKYNYSLLYSFKTNSFALSPMSIGSGTIYNAYHNLPPAEKDELVRDIVNTLADVMSPEELAEYPIGYRIVNPESQGQFSSRNKTASSSKQRLEELPPQMDEIIPQFVGLVHNMGPDGNLVDINAHAYDQLVGKVMTDEQAGSRIENAKKADISWLKPAAGTISYHTQNESDDDNGGQRE